MIHASTSTILYEEDKVYLYENLITYALKRYDINKHLYNNSVPFLKKIINKNYVFKQENYHFDNVNISFSNLMQLTKHILLKKGNIVWLELSANISNNITNTTPAIILKNLGSEVLVIPLSSKKPKENFLKIKNVAGLENSFKWCLISKIYKVSILKINFNEIIGFVNKHDLKILTNKIKDDQLLL